MSLRSPLSRVLGSGSAKEGTEHWWQQRVNSLALLVLGFWFAFAIAGLDSYDHAVVAAWVASPFNSIMLLLLCTTMVWHSLLGIQVVIEDYVHGPGLKVFSLVLSKFLHAFLGIAAAFAILKIFVGGAG